MNLTLLDRVNLGRLWMQGALREHRRWKKQSDRHGIRVFYGFDRLPSPGEKASGGIIKVQDLQADFPNQVTGANILYLVSSALPHFAVRMAELARRAGALVVLNQNGVAYPGWYGPGWEQANRPLRRLLHLADYVIYQSHFCRQAADKFLGPREGAFEILHNPVDTGIFKPDPQQAARHDEAVNLLLAGSHQSYYRVRVAVEALQLVLREFPRARLIVAGRCCWERDEEQALARIKRLVSELGLGNQVDFIGPYAQSRAPAMFNRAQVLLHTKYNDPCPRLVVEGMACGLPVVYSATGGVPELVGAEAGKGVAGPLDWEQDHSPDPRALAAALVEVVSHLDRYGRAARRRVVENFDVRPWLERHRQIFAQLLKS